MNRQLAAVFVIDKAMLLELIHEMTDPRPGCADHLRQLFLIDSGNHGFGPALLAKMGQQTYVRRLGNSRALSSELVDA